jgi:hypothetical protein
MDISSDKVWVRSLLPDDGVTCPCCQHPFSTCPCVLDDLRLPQAQCHTHHKALHSEQSGQADHNNT